MNSDVASTKKDCVSVVAAFLDERECIGSFCEHMEAIAKTAPFDIELILVDDGSRDETVELISAFPFIFCTTVKLISLSKNFGSHAALRAGLQQAEGDYSVFIGVDLQEPDDMIMRMYELIIKGNHAVYIEKKTTKTSFGERTFSRMYSFLMRKFAVKDYGPGGINNIMMNRKVLEFINNNIEVNSSLHLQIINAEFKHETVPMPYNERTSGRSKWTLGKKIKLFIDSFVAFSFLPIRAVSVLGIIMALVGLIYMLVVVIMRLVNPESIALGFPTIISVLLVGFGVTNISLGVIAEYLWRTFDAARGRPTFVISSIETIKP